MRAQKPRDPRFDEQAGELAEDHHLRNYAFVEKYGDPSVVRSRACADELRQDSAERAGRDRELRQEAAALEERSYQDARPADG